MNTESCFVIIQYDKEMKKAVVDQLKQVTGVDKIEELEDETQIRVKITAESKERLQGIIAWKIQKMACIHSVHRI